MIQRATSPDVEADERTPLIGAPRLGTDRSPSTHSTHEEIEEVAEAGGSLVWAVLPILLLGLSPSEVNSLCLDLLFILFTGVFIAQADSSIVLATNQEIASGFGALSDSSWLITTYALAQCACQPLVCH